MAQLLALKTRLVTLVPCGRCLFCPSVCFMEVRAFSSQQPLGSRTSADTPSLALIECGHLPRLVSARMATRPVKGKSDQVPSLSWACAPRSITIHLPPVLLSSKHPSHSLAALNCCAPCICPAVPFGPNLPFQVVSSYQLPHLSCDQPGQGTSAITHFRKPQGLSGSLQ